MSILYIVLVMLMPSPSASQCHFHRPRVAGFSREGDILIGAVIAAHADRVFPGTAYTALPAPISCQKFHFQNYQRIQGMVFALREINENPHLLSNLTLGYRIYDSCTVLQRTLDGTFWMLTEQDQPMPNYRCQESPRLAAIIGDSASTRSIIMAHLLGRYKIPQVSYFSTSPLLSDRNQFPSFFRTIPSDDFQSRGLAQLVIHFGWAWVGLLAVDSDYGRQVIQILQKELVQAGVCIAFSENILTSQVDRNAFHIVQVIKNSKATAIVIISADYDMAPVVDEIVRQNVTAKVWIGSEGWATSTFFPMEKYAGALVGSLGFAIHSGDMPGFTEYLSSVHPSKSPGDTLIRTFWEEAFGCKWLGQETLFSSMDNNTNPCSGVEKFSSLRVNYNDVTDLRVTYNIYSAVYAIALALQDLISCKPGEGPFLNGNCANITHFQSWQLLHYVKSVRFQSEFGTEAVFDENGNPPARYDIINWQLSPHGTVQHVMVGSYDPSTPSGQHLLINVSAIQWADGGTQVPLSVCSPSCPPGFRKITIPGEPVCCFQCVLCPQGEISNHSESISCIHCSWDKWPNSRQDQCIAKNTEFLGYEEPLGAILAAISLFLSSFPIFVLGLFHYFRDTPIVRANNRALSYHLLLSIMLCFLCSWSFIGYPAPEKCLLRQAAFGIIFAFCVSCILAKTIMVVIAFKATKPNSDFRRWVGPKLSYLIIGCGTVTQICLCLLWLIVYPPFMVNNIHTNPGKIIIECNEGSPIAFWCMLGYLGLLASISFIVAFLARHLPGNFNEAKCITFSMLAFLSVWLAFIPTYLSSKGKYMVAMEVFAILSSSSALLFCIFSPTCYILLLRPDMNTKQFLMGRER
ncbi:extracellular calcium-sensing receptor-like [Ambystoma mexicanum]|uniref:extracellular calcium-sensing receptor-like n=1 Tax=Ambystoma mexicanum TaxID=8296 RepID=UPI0037E911BB